MTACSIDYGFISVCCAGDIVKLVVACILGGAIGLEREATKHPAGLRTHILVALGSTTFVLLAFVKSDSIAGIPTIDAGRIMQGVITGVGFIGAGAIIKEGSSIRGLTTAASLWLTSAVGLLVGVGAIPLAALTTLVALVALVLSRHRGHPDDQPPA